MKIRDLLITEIRKLREAPADKYAGGGRPYSDYGSDPLRPLLWGLQDPVGDFGQFRTPGADPSAVANYPSQQQAISQFAQSPGGESDPAAMAQMAAAPTSGNPNQPGAAPLTAPDARRWPELPTFPWDVDRKSDTGAGAAPAPQAAPPPLNPNQGPGRPDTGLTTPYGPTGTQIVANPMHPTAYPSPPGAHTSADYAAQMQQMPQTQITAQPTQPNIAQPQFSDDPRARETQTQISAHRIPTMRELTRR